LQNLSTDKDMQSEALIIRGRWNKIIPYVGAFDVIDPATHRSIGAVRNKSWLGSLFMRPEWLFLDVNGHEIGCIQVRFSMILQRYVGKI